MLRCHCSRCQRTGRVWPSYYVGLWIWMAKFSAPPDEWVVRWLSFDCWLDGLEPDLAGEPSAILPNDQQAMNEGLSVHDPDRRSIFAPLMSGECEACGELREARWRFCLSCAAKVRRACKEVQWSSKLIEEYMKAPINGRDEFAEGTIDVVRA